MADDDLDRWIDAIRQRLATGKLAGVGPIELGHGTGGLVGETVIRIMLADLADLDDPEGSAARDATWREARRRDLVEDFRRLRVLLG